MSDAVLIEAAAETLYGAAASAFTAERKRLADELKAAGARKAAAAIAKLPKPSTSAWVINQLHRAAALDRLFAASARVRTGDAAAASDQRAAIAELRERAAVVLASDGHAVTPAVLQRIVTTLQALAAIGSFAPDAPGRLLVDRDPPGFDAMVGVTLAAPVRAPTPPAIAPASTPASTPTLTSVPMAPPIPAGPTPAELKARAEERARRERVAAAARQTATDRRVEVRQLRGELTLAEAAVLRARERLAAAEAALAAAETQAAAAQADLADADA